MGIVEYYIAAGLYAIDVRDSRRAVCWLGRGSDERRRGVEYPEELRYSREHEWARSEEGRVRVGITDFAQDALGDVVYVDLPSRGPR